MALDERSDVDLLRAAGAGDRGAFADFYDRHAEAVFGYCRRIVDDDQDAADAAQEAFLGLLTREHEAPGSIAEPAAYLFRAARNGALRIVARQRRLRPVEEVPERALVAGLPEGEQRVLTEDLQASVRAANQRLPVRQREVLALREVEGLSYEEIGQRMDLTPNAAAQLAWRARGRFRRHMRHGALVGITTMSDDCERAMTLTTLAEDAALDDEDAAWLAEHLESCERCRASRAVMAEVGTTYRLWMPGLALVAAARGDVLAHAGELVGLGTAGSATAGSGSGGAASTTGGSQTAAIAATVGTSLVAAAAAAGLLFTGGDGKPNPPPSTPPPSVQGSAAQLAPTTPPAASKSRTRGPSAFQASLVAARRPQPSTAAPRAAPPAPPAPAPKAQPREPAAKPPAERPAPRQPAERPATAPAQRPPQEAPAAATPPTETAPEPAAPTAPGAPAPEEPEPSVPPPAGPPGVGVGGTPPGHGGPRPGIGQGGTPPGHLP